jgi:hypothetical protein
MYVLLAKAIEWKITKMLASICDSISVLPQDRLKKIKDI